MGDHGSTFAGGPVIAAAALAALEICSDDSLLARVRRLGERLMGGVRGLAYASEVRGRGLMVGFDVAGGERAPDLARRALIEHQLVVNATGPGTIRLEPPLIVSEEEIDEALERLRALSE
jgi:acetylornithine/succinyldiaminopimelate/putrescine aminotransferase